MSAQSSFLYPRVEPYAVHRIQVDPVHDLYVEECGHPEGLPALFLHGGPGAGCEPAHRRFFDPARYRVVLFDQRGCGRSSPHAELAANTTWHLVADIERIRNELGIDRWLVFGGSWGSTLALAYAQRYPQRVRALVIRGVFLCRDSEIHWFYRDGANRFFPEWWQDFIAPIPPDERDDLLAAFQRRLLGHDEAQRLEAAQAWSLWEGRTATLRPNPDVQAFFAEPRVALSLARIECHYFVNRAFLEPGQLLRDAFRIAEVPGVIVQGRYDVICPPCSAWELHQLWPASELRMVSDAGHAAFETGIQRELVAATDRFATEPR